MTKRLHSHECRRRLYVAMQDDEEDRNLLSRALVRMTGRVEQGSNPVGADEPMAPVDQSAAAGPSQGTPAEEEEQAVDILDMEPLLESDDIPIGSPDLFDDREDEHSVSGDHLVQEEVTNAADDDDDSDGDDQMPQLEQPRGVKARRASAEDTQSVVSSNLAPAKRPKTRHGDDDESVRTFEEILKSDGRIDHVSVKAIIEELEKEPELRLKVGNHRQRRTAAQQCRKHVSEVYSPPRICERARELGLDPGSSLDLTTQDEHGVPWDLSKPEIQKKAMMRIDEEKPELLVTCPMCGPFSAWQGLNYANMEEVEIKHSLAQSLEYARVD